MRGPPSLCAPSQDTLRWKAKKRLPLSQVGFQLGRITRAHDDTVTSLWAELAVVLQPPERSLRKGNVILILP